MSLNKIDTEYAFDDVVTKHEKFYFLKNSTTCPISGEAFKVYETVAQQLDGPMFYLNVQEARPLSNTIAERYQIKHESPQVLLFQNGQVIWHDSHWRVTETALKEKWLQQ